MERRTRVYVSGALTTGMLTANVNRAVEIGNQLLHRGYAAYVPHTNILWEMLHPPIDDPAEAYELWLSHDFEWILASDVMLRMRGESRGADREVAFAVNHGISVYLSLDTLYACERPIRLVDPCWSCGKPMVDQAEHARCRGNA